MFNNKRESFGEKLLRHRSILTLVSLPVILVFVVLYSVPRSPLSLSSKPTLDFPSANLEELIYSIVIDAGSTGSRVHVLSFSGGSTNLKLLNDHFKQIKPGLSSYANNATAAALSLYPLVDEALKVIPEDKQSSTPISVRATAGLRLLKGNQAEAILDAVRSYLDTFPFKHSAASVSILDGQEEGAFAWLTLNYLLGRLDPSSSLSSSSSSPSSSSPSSSSSSSSSSSTSKAKKTVAAVDLGGGSVQEAFLMPKEVADKAPKGYVKTLSALGQTFQVYVHSYLGYGLMAARAQMLGEALPAALRGSCFATGVKGTYSYAGKSYEYAGVHGAAEAEDKSDAKSEEGREKEKSDKPGCSELGVKALKKEQDCGVKRELAACSFAGAWRGHAKIVEEEYYVSSYFFDRAVDAGIITDKNAAQWIVTPKAFQDAAAVTCAAGSTLTDLTKKYPNVATEQLPFFCMDLSYCAALLLEGFALPADRNVTLVKQVSYHGKMIEAAWPLGAALNELGGM